MDPKRLALHLLLFGLISCELPKAPPRPPGELIVGKWKLEKFDLPADAKAKLDQREKAQLAQFQMMLGTMRYNFFNDGTYAIDAEMGDDFKENMERGTYQLMNDGSVLSTQPTNTEPKRRKPTEYVIQKLSEDSLLLGEQDKSKGTLILIRSNTETGKK